MSTKRKRSPTPDPAAAGAASATAPPIYRSQPIEDRASTFIGLYSPTLPARALQALPELHSASHRMLGWRRASNQQAVTGATRYVSGHDDDGEKGGGRRVERVLQTLQIGHGACVVARWYGGVMLGPVRFEHIEAAARGAVLACRAREEELRAEEERATREAEEARELVGVLGARDDSVAVLRALAADKEAALAEARGEARATPPASTVNANGNGEAKSTPKVTPKVNYADMAVDRLRVLEKARDATLAFLLKRIDKAEVELKRLAADKPDDTKD